jgi:hypothetical protein
LCNCVIDKVTGTGAGADSSSKSGSSCDLADAKQTKVVVAEPPIFRGGKGSVLHCLTCEKAYKVETEEHRVGHCGNCISSKKVSYVRPGAGGDNVNGCVIALLIRL